MPRAPALAVVCLAVASAGCPKQAAFQPPDRPLCIAHRGNNVDHLENSWASVRSAVELEADGVEFDVHHTRDGVGFLMHDKDMSRVARSRDGAQCPLTTPFSKVDAATVRAACELSNGEPIAPLDEVLAWLVEQPILTVVELKDHPSPSTLAALEATFAGRYDQLRVISFDRKALLAVADHFDAIEGAEAVETYYLGVWVPLGNRRFDGVDVHFGDAPLVRRFVSAGRTFGVWTIDAVDDMIAWANKGVSFLTTNDPKTCLETFPRGG